jgi:hypothetical protein
VVHRYRTSRRLIAEQRNTVAMAFAVAKTASKAFAGRKATRARTSSKVVCAASDRTLWLPSISAPSHLNGTLPGDFGFDPLVSLCIRAHRAEHIIKSLLALNRVLARMPSD